MISVVYIRKPGDFVENEVQTDQVLVLSNKEATEFIRYQLKGILSTGAPLFLITGGILLFISIFFRHSLDNVVKWIFRLMGCFYIMLGIAGLIL